MRIVVISGLEKRTTPLMTLAWLCALFIRAIGPIREKERFFPYFLTHDTAASFIFVIVGCVFSFFIRCCLLASVAFINPAARLLVV